MRLTVLLAALSLSAAASASVPAEPRSLAGPARICGTHFALEARAGESVAFQQGPDFDLYFFRSPSRGFGLYEGFAPDTFQNSRTPISHRGRTIQRLHDPDSGWSYLIAVPDTAVPETAPQMYLHLFGAAWQGNDADLPLLDRVQIGSAGCERRTFELAR